MWGSWVLGHMHVDYQCVSGLVLVLSHCINDQCYSTGGRLESLVLSLMGVARGRYVYKSDLLELESCRPSSPLIGAPGALPNCGWIICSAIDTSTRMRSLPRMCFEGWQTALPTLPPFAQCITTTPRHGRTPASSQITSRPSCGWVDSLGHFRLH